MSTFQELLEKLGLKGHKETTSAVISLVSLSNKITNLTPI